MAEKAKYWVGVCYPENMKEDWESEIGNLLQMPYCYCIHNMCNLQNGEDRKIHVHIIIAFPNTTTKKTALTLFNKLSKDNSVCCPSCEQVHNIRFMYNYLIHDTEDCRKKKKYLYSPLDRKCGNNFDIGCYEQISSDEKLEMKLELTDLIIDNNFENLKDFYKFCRSNYDKVYLEVATSHAIWFSQICKANFLENHSRR